MKVKRIAGTFTLIAAGLLLAGCSLRRISPTPEPLGLQETARAQTRTFEEALATSLAATLTAAPAGTPTPTTTASPTAAAPAATDTPLATSSPAPGPTPTPQPLPTSTPAPTDTPPPTNTPVPIPTDTPPPTATPTQEKLVIGESDVDGDDGNDFLRGSSERNEGRVILLPGFEQSEVGDTVVFRDRIVFRVEVFDTRAGTHDGAGIQEVRFQIVSDEGEVVHERTERVAGYCVFGGGEPDCNVLSLSQQPSYWPESGLEIRSGGYQANIDIMPEDGDQTQWRWSFLIELPGAASEAPPGAARMTRITRAADLS